MSIKSDLPVKSDEFDPECLVVDLPVPFLAYGPGPAEEGDPVCAEEDLLAKLRWEAGERSGRSSGR